MLPPITLSTKRLASMKIGVVNPFVYAQQELILERLEHMETSLRKTAETRLDKLMSELDGGVTSNVHILIENAKAELYLAITREMSAIQSTIVTEAESANAALQEEVTVLKAQLEAKSVDIETTAEHVSALNTEAAALQEEMSKLITEVSDAKNANAALKAQLEARDVDTEAAALQEEVSKLITEVSDAKSANAVLKAELDAKSVDTEAAVVTEEKSANAALQEEVRKLKAKLEARSVDTIAVKNPQLAAWVSESANAALQEEVRKLKAQLEARSVDSSITTKGAINEEGKLKAQLEARRVDTERNEILTNPDAMLEPGWAEAEAREQTRNAAWLSEHTKQQAPSPSVGSLQLKAAKLTKGLEAALKRLGDKKKKRIDIRENALNAIGRINERGRADDIHQLMLRFHLELLQDVDNKREAAYTSRANQELFMEQIVIDTVCHMDDAVYTSIGEIITAEKIKHVSKVINESDLLKSIKRLGYIMTAVDAQIEVVRHYINWFKFTTVALVNKLEPMQYPNGLEDSMMVKMHNQLVEKKIVERAMVSIHDRLRDLKTILRDDWFYVKDRKAQENMIRDLGMQLSELEKPIESESGGVPT